MLASWIRGEGPGAGLAFVDFSTDGRNVTGARAGMADPNWRPLAGRIPSRPLAGQRLVRQVAGWLEAALIRPLT